ncbi:30S ribosomal protein S1 [Clostridium intestinale]|uniref:30S ribosomal protein S1 n=1 Tax=Clostridium intestinale URNW TaxID=1294142 RepID=U2NT54_9CLOT|nr:30S ribosomal protein S1 [Clostridium intestinale]ERK32026.1 30S ribosomal protein S1 [Clostridium intestinale URNW]
MNNEENNSMSMADLLKDYDVKKLNVGDIVKGEILSINNDEAMVNINYYRDGIVKRSEISHDEVEVSDVLNVGDTINLMIVSLDDGDGNVLLSKNKADEIIAWDEVKASYKNNETLTLKVKEQVKGGVVALYKGIRVFIPGSQVSRERGVELSTLVGKELEVRVIEFDKRDKKVVASRRILEEAQYNEEKKALWNLVKKGEKREGKVTRIAKFGAFVDIGGIEGLVHISDLAWGRVKRVEDVVSVGDVVEVYVGDFDKEKERLSLAIKDIKKDPWEDAKATLKVNDVVTGKVVKFLNFGAFVEVLPGVEGLVHISEITEENIAKPSDVLTIGGEVKVKILDINSADKKMSLSIKEAVEKSREYEKFNDDFEGESLAGLFKDFKF